MNIYIRLPVWIWCSFHSGQYLEVGLPLNCVVNLTSEETAELPPCGHTTVQCHWPGRRGSAPWCACSHLVLAVCLILAVLLGPWWQLLVVLVRTSLMTSFRVLLVLCVSFMKHLFLNCIVCLIELYIWMQVRYMYCRYFLLICGLPCHFLSFYCGLRTPNLRSTLLNF